MAMSEWEWLVGLLLVPGITFMAWLNSMRRDLDGVKLAVAELTRRQESVDEFIDEMRQTLPVMASHVEDLWNDSRTVHLIYPHGLADLNEARPAPHSAEPR